MPHHKTKVGSLTPIDPSEISQSTSRNTPKRKMSVKVSTISQNSLNRIRILYPRRQNKSKSNDEHEDLFDHIDLREMINELSSIQRLPTSNSTVTKSAQSFHRPISTTSLKHCDSAIKISKITQNKDHNKKTNQYTYETTESNENNPTRRRYYKGRICPWCSNCCCLALILALLLLLAGLAALLVYIFTLSRSTTTTVTTTTTTSVTTTTTTSSTSTTSTTTTTTATTTTTTSTTSTSTSSTSTTSRTTTTTTTITPTPPCSPTSVGSASTLYSASSGSGTAYNCYAYEWTSPTTGLVTLTFQLRHDPAYWYVDDVSVYEGGTQKLINGDFETGSLSPWVVTHPFGSCGSYGGQVSSSSPRSGSYSYADGSNSCADQVSQQFTATLGQVYVVSYWLKSGGTGSVISALVTLS